MEEKGGNNGIKLEDKPWLDLMEYESAFSRRESNEGLMAALQPPLDGLDVLSRSLEMGKSLTLAIADKLRKDRFMPCQEEADLIKLHQDTAM